MMRHIFCLPAFLLAGACASDYPDSAAVAAATADRVADPSMPQRTFDGAEAAPPLITAPITAPVTEAALTGVASWYGPRHQGRHTAGGERYDMRAFTAAHPSLPMGTRLRVIETATGRSVAVTVNDRGPHVAGRILDLSWRAAHELGIVRAGLAVVTLQVMPTAESRLSVTPPSRRTGIKPQYPPPDVPADGHGSSSPFLNAQVADRSDMTTKQVTSTRVRP